MRTGRNILVINCDLRETRVALIEDGVIAELQLERASARGTVGNVVLGKVTRVLPGMQAAFIDVGMDRAAFLHVEDLIRPDDFELYLTGRARDSDEEPSGRGAGGRRHLARLGLMDDDDVDLNGSDDDDGGDDDGTDDDGEGSTSDTLDASSPPEGDDDHDGESDDDSDDHDSDDHDSDDDNGEGSDDHDSDDDSDDHDSDDHDSDDDSDDHDSDDDNGEGSDDHDEPAVAEAENGIPTEAVSSPDVPAEAEALEEPCAEPEPAQPKAPPVNGAAEGPRVRPAADDALQTAAAQAEELGAVAAQPEALETARLVSKTPALREDERGGRGRRRRRSRRGKPGGNGKEAPKRAAPEPARAKAAAGRRRGRPSSPSRVSRSVPITEVVKEGDEVVVQISKEPIGTKGARVTSHVSLPGRYVVYLPTVEHIGISKRIGSPKERSRLRKVIEALKPPTGGLIVRTVAEGLTKKGLKTDVGYLIKLWADVAQKRANARSPATLYAELDLVLKTARDLFTDEIEKIVIDDKEQYARLVRFVEMFMPERVKDIELYTDDEPIFDAYGIEDEIARALSRKVPLPSGGYLIIDQAEALTAIDVNTGRFVGKGSKDLEETAFKTNLEAVDEIAYQLRFRNIGGLVILDLIDMDVHGNREKVWRVLEQRLAKDKAKTTINRISELGLIEMTRKRTRESLSRTMHEPCFYCDGTGQIQSRTTIAYEILRQIRRERHSLPGYVVQVNAHPAVVDLMTGEEKAAVTEAERRYMRRIEFNARREYHIEQFDLQGR